MRKSQQTNSRKRAALRTRQVMRLRRLKALWLTLIVTPLMQAGQNTRANRLERISRIRMEV
jgi:hypothetical protein